MSVKEKIARIKAKAAKVAVKAATLATIATSAVACNIKNYKDDRNTDENGNKIENVEGKKTSVVFRVKQNNNGYDDSTNQILLENGDVLSDWINPVRDGTFLEVGDTVTYNGKDIEAVRYKGGAGKNVNFGKIGKIEKDITD